MRKGLFLWLAGAACAAAFVACAESNDEGAGSSSGGTGTQIQDASVSEAAPRADANADADADAAPAATRTCSDDGFCHTAVPSNEVFRGVWGDGTGVVWAVTSSGRIFRWDGAAWTLHTEVLHTSFRAVWGSGPTDIWVAGAGGVMHGTGASSSAITFAAVDVPGDPSVPMKAVWGTGPSDVWIVGGSTMTDWPNDVTSRAAHYTGSPDSGTQGWEVADLPEDIDYDGVWGSPGSGVWVRGTAEPGPDNNWSPAAAVRRLAPGATTWEAIDLPPSPAPGDFLPMPGSITAGGSGGDTSVWLAGTTQSKKMMYWRGTSSDGGQTFTWTCIPREPDLVLTGVWGQGPNDTWAIGEYGRVRHWDGSRWKQAAIMVAALPVKNPLYGIWGLGNDDFWVVGDGIAMHKTATTP